uniref:Uncharacterized protein n=1 Tax=Populus trichocarpa TaxID=3694 RepID=A0A3N7EQ62_POPTR
MASTQDFPCSEHILLLQWLYSAVQVMLSELRFGMDWLSISGFILLSMNFLLFWFLIQTPSNLVRSHFLSIGNLVEAASTEDYIRVFVFLYMIYMM